MRTKQQNDRFYKGHEQLAEFCGTELIVANGVAHMIPSLAPELVMSKIKAILERK